MITWYSGLCRDLVAYDPHHRRIPHLLKVASYAMIIAGDENLDGETTSILLAAALLHDVGIKPALEQHGSSAGQYQQQEGPAVASRLMQRHGFPDHWQERICYLIAHHHEYGGIAGADYQILVEADFLVNFDESNMDRDSIQRVRDTVFRTTCGVDMVNRLFLDKD